MEMHEYSPGEVVPLTSALYRVVHEPPDIDENLRTFYAGEDFPICPKCGMKVRYLLPVRVLRSKP
jgi:hypothetical protein